MERRVISRFGICLATFAIVASLSSIGLANAGCGVPGAVLCGGGASTRLGDLATYLPVAAPVDSLGDGWMGTAGLVTKCRYTKTTHATGSSSPESEPWSQSLYAVDDHQDAYAASRAFAAFKPRASSAWTVTEAGTTVLLRNWPQPSSVTVTWPWAVRGVLDADADVRGSTAKATVNVSLVLKQADVPASKTIVQDSMTSTFGPETKNVVRDGTDSLTVATPSNLTYKGFVRIRAEADANLSWSGTAASVAAASRFWPNSGGAFTEYQDWKFNMPPGWTITNCGGGVPIH